MQFPFETAGFAISVSYFHLLMLRIIGSKSDQLSPITPVRARLCRETRAGLTRAGIFPAPQGLARPSAWPFGTSTSSFFIGGGVAELCLARRVGWLTRPSASLPTLLAKLCKVPSWLGLVVRLRLTAQPSGISLDLQAYVGWDDACVRGRAHGRGRVCARDPQPALFFSPFYGPPPP